jgi:Zn-dependent protease with chaperone function
LWLYARPLRRLSADAHWSAVARHYWHLRIARTLSIIWIVTAATASSYHDLTKRGDPWMIVLIAGSALAGCIIGSRAAGRGLPLPETVRKGNLRSMLTHLLLFPGGPSLLILMALTFRRGVSTESFTIAGAILILNIVLIMGGSVAILRMTGLLKPVDEPLQKSAREQAAQQGVPLRHVMKMDLPMANAFAFPWTKDLGFTSATLATLNDEELQSVISHELGHLRESLPTRWSRLTGLLSIFTIGLAPAAFIDGQPFVALGLLAGYIGVSRLAAWIHKRLEISADQHAHGTESEDGVYARALEKIHKASLIPAVLHPRSPYPSLYDRMTDAGVNPDFPRPAPPGRVLPMLCGVFATGLFYFVCQKLLAALA